MIWPPTSPRSPAGFRRRRLGGLLGLAALVGLAASPALSQPDETGALALSLVNRDRSQHGLPPLDWALPLAEAAQTHAEDMLRRDYYSHSSPEGDSVRDRYLDAGGSRWRVVAENIAMCEGCDTPAGPDRVRAFQNGWMQSRGHRENILMRGLDGFGFAMVSGDGVVYAVQTFAGPGTAPGAAPDAAPADAAALRDEALSEINAARRAAGAAPLLPDAELDTVAQSIAADTGFVDGGLSLPDDVYAYLPRDGDGWRQLSVAASACGGCGAQPVAGDGARMADDLAPEPDGPFSHAGFAVTADGTGRKLVVAVYGAR